MVFSRHEPVDDSLSGIARKFALFDHKLMEVVSQEVSTGSAPVPVVNSEK